MDRLFVKIVAFPAFHLSRSFVLFCCFNSIRIGNCDADDLQEDAAAGYTNCVKAYSTISLLASENIDSVILQRSTLLRVRAFVTDPNSMESLSTLYDYPKLVQSSVLLRLVGQAVAMDDDEQFLFLQTFQEGFQPILEGDSYEWIEAKIIAQQAGTATPDLTIEESDKGDLYNRVELMMRAQCSGNACTDENFGNWLTQNVKAYSQEFLGRLFTVGPPEKDMYYDELRSIDVGESLLIEPLNPPKLTDTTNSEPSDAEMPAWLWAVLVAAVALLAFAVAWTCVRVGARKGAEMRRNSTEKQSKNFHGSQADGGSSVRGNSVASGSKHDVENVTPEEPEEERI